MKYTVSKEKHIHAAKEDIIKHIADLNNWSHWSPWSCLDPQTVIDVKTDYLMWESRFTGSGKMQVVTANDNMVEIDLNFIKPFKSKAKVTFKLEQISANETKVIWHMASKLPFFLCFFKKLFQVMIGHDFERGLTRLKYLVETGNIPVRLEYFDTPEEVAGFRITGISSSCHMSNIANSMREAFTRLHTLITNAQIVPTGMVCLCDKVRLTKQMMYYTAAAVYDGGNVQSQELKSRIIPTHKVLKVVLHGSYDFMGDAWSGAYTHVRALKLKMDKRVPPYEVYIKGPHNTEDSAEYITEIRMPVRSK